MKRMVALLAFLLTAISVPAFAADEFVEAQDHGTLASLYQKKASEQNSLINQHERMMKDSDFMRKNPSATAQGEMARHCSAIVEKAKALKEELSKAGSWHANQG